MRDHQPHADHKVTLLGGAPIEPKTLSRALALAPRLVAADGGAEHARILGHRVNRIIGDLDSLTTKKTWQNSGTDVTEILEQESTDFEKCIYTENSDYYLCVGFLGQRVDHTLANLGVLLAYRDKRIILMGEEDITFLCPVEFEMEMAAGTRVSLFPMAKIKGEDSQGLRWTIKGLNFSPDGRLGTSNEALGGRVSLRLSGSGMLMILPISMLEAVIEARLGAIAVPDKSGKARPR